MSNSRALEMFQSGQGADCVIEVAPQIDGQEKQEFKVHKYVLMVNSDVFMEILSHEDTKEARVGRIQINDSTSTAVRQMLIFMYTWELPEEYAIETDAGPLMHIANKYQIKSLVKFIEQELINSYRTILEEINSRALEIFQSGHGANCVIEVVSQIHGQEKQEFNVNKYVLMVNSDVFHAMFSHENTKEAREGRIVIEDSTPSAVRQMLIHMYTYSGALPKEYNIETDAGPLLYIANKYLIKSLVKFIEQELIASLSLAKVLDRWEMADLCQINSLCSSCGLLIQPNLKMVKNDDKWLKLKQKSTKLAFSVLEEIVDKFENRNDVHICTCSDPQPDRKCYNCGYCGHLAYNCYKFYEY